MGLFGRAKSRPEQTPSKSAPANSLIVTPVWGAQWQNMDVSGESNYGKEIRALLPRKLREYGDEVTIDVLLVREPRNLHDRNAVAINAPTGTLGYLPREEAARYAPALDALIAGGRVAQTSARVWGTERMSYDSDRKEFVGSVRIALPEPHLMFPINVPPPTAHVLLPDGSAMQVSVQGDYRENLVPWLNDHGAAWVHATLHSVVEKTARTTKTLVEVRIDARPVGRLTPRMSEEMLPVIDHLAGIGLDTAVRAMVKGNALKSHVTLHTARAGELSAEWLARVDQMRTMPAQPAKRTPLQPVAPEQGQTEPSVTTPTAPPPPTQLPPANWYPDPQGIRRLRFWDGSQWTDLTSE